MHALNELGLPHLPVTDAAFAADPFPHFTAAREKHPWLATSDIGYVFTEYTAMRELFIQDDKLRPSLDPAIAFLGSNENSRMRRWMVESFTMMPRGEHRRVRNLFASSFTPRHANEMRGLIRTTVQRLLDEWTPKETFDFGEFASWFPIEIMFNMLGAPTKLVASCRDDLHTMGLLFSFNKSLLKELERAFIRLETLAHDLIADRLRNSHSQRTPNLLDDIIAAGANGSLDPSQIADTVIIFIVAAYDSTKNMLSLLMSLLIERPDIYRRCAEDLDYCTHVVEEALRYQSTATALRVTTDDVLFRDVLIPTETTLFFPFSISGRDPGTFPDGHAFDPDRTISADRHHIAFGLGQHICIGRHIARVELQEALHLIAQRIQEPRLAGKITWRPFPGIWGPESLPITFTPE